MRHSLAQAAWAARRSRKLCNGPMVLWADREAPWNAHRDRRAKLRQMQLTEAERQLLIAFWSPRAHAPRSATGDELTRHVVDDFDEDAVDLEDAFSGLTRRGWLIHEPADDTYRLVGDGVEQSSHLHRAHSAERFGKWMTTAERSATYAEYCRRIYGLPLVQFGMVDAEQLELLLSLFGTDDRRLLDLGCGIGTTTELIADRTGAHVTGVDFASLAIDRAKTRTAAKRDQLAFAVADLDRLALPAASFDLALALDTLYFVANLEAVVGTIFSVLRPGGRLLAFFTSIVEEDEPRELLEPDGTKLARALRAHAATFTTVDLTAAGHRLWREARRAAADLEAAFRAEDNEKLWRSRDRESTSLLKCYDTGRARRYLYEATAR